MRQVFFDYELRAKPEALLEKALASWRTRGLRIGSAMMCPGWEPVIGTTWDGIPVVYNGGVLRQEVHLDSGLIEMVPSRGGATSSAAAEHEETPDSGSTGEPTGGRPRRVGVVRCPTCSQRVRPEQLGVWWGWAEGKAPPYWDALRAHIFERDGHRCQMCGARERLIPHHIVPKEDGGSDSSRNLMAVCVPCHDTHHDRIGELRAEYIVGGSQGQD